MRTLIILSFVLVSTAALAGTTIVGDSNSPLDKYTVTQLSENLWQLTYSKSSAAFTIEVCRDKNECCYLLRGEQIELMYLCSKRGFGLRRMPDNQSKLGTSAYRNLICRESYNQQSVITPNRQTTSEALGLIACFFPIVINNDSYTEVFRTPAPEERMPTVVQN